MFLVIEFISMDLEIGFYIFFIEFYGIWIRFWGKWIFWDIFFLVVNNWLGKEK